MKRLFTIASLVIVMLLIVGNSGNAGFLDDILKVASKVAPLVTKDSDIGLLFAQGVEKQYGLDQNPERNTKVQQLGQKILSANNITTKYDFSVLANHEFNACSIYGGHIRVNEGLLYDTQNNDAETAFAIAHEIAHNELGHNKAAVKNFKIASALELANVSKNMPKLLVLGVNAVMAKRSRENESAADAKALEYMAKAGYKITGAIAIARRIEAEHIIAQKNAGNSSLVAQRFNSIFDTHPEPAKRAEMAEDVLFTQKYGSTFKQVSGTSTTKTGSYYGDCVFIVAHPSMWQSPLRVTDQISGVGIFNPSPFATEIKDVDYFIDFCLNDHLVAVTCDNDGHDPLDAIGSHSKETNELFTFVEGDYADQDQLIKAIKEGRTYASAVGIELKEMNFPIGQKYPNVNYPKLTFKVTTGYNLQTLIVYRDGKKWLDKDVTIKGESIVSRDGVYTIEDKDVEKGKHWYVIYSPLTLITSPITLNVTRKSKDPIELSGSDHWQKGIIHYHSFYSDGKSKSIQEIWDSGRKSNVGFVFMTDHADRIKENGDHAYSRYTDDCERASPSMVPGVEYSLRKLHTGISKGNHILILNPKEYKNYEEIDEEAFFNGQQGQYQDKVLIMQGPFHLGDDVVGSEIEADALFNFKKINATLKLRIKGSPFKDPILWINRHEIGRVVTTDNQWHWFEFQVQAEWLNNGKNLFSIESFIPKRQNTFDDCEVADVYIYSKV